MPPEVATVGKAEERRNLHTRIQELAAKANDDSQEWNPEDETEWKEVNARYDRLSAAVRNIGREDRRGEPGGIYKGQGDDVPTARGPAFRNTETGKEIRALTRDDRLPGDDSSEGLNVGGFIADLLTGRNDHCSDAERRAMLGSTDTSGGYFLTPKASSIVVDLARSASVCMAAGALTLPMETPEMTIARVTGDPTAYWRAEGQRITSSSQTFDRVTLRAKTLAAIVPVSVELWEDSANIAQIIESSLRAQLGLRLDQAILRGAGSANEPLGIKNTTGVNTVTSVGAPDDYQEITSAIGKIYNANFQGDPSALSWIMNPREGMKYGSLEDTTGQPLQPTPWASKLQRQMTTSLLTTEGGGGAESSMVVGHFPECVVGMRTTGVKLEVFNTGSATTAASVTESALDQMLVFVRAYLRADVAVLRPDHFTVLSGVTA